MSGEYRRYINVLLLVLAPQVVSKILTKAIRVGKRKTTTRYDEEPCGRVSRSVN